jgi:hypothetical protein
MTTYRVKWEIDLDADTPEDAAACAQAIQRDRESIGTVFDVTELCNDGGTLGTRTRVDLCGHPECQAGANGVRMVCRFSEVSSQPKAESEPQILERLDTVLDECANMVSHEAQCVTRLHSACACNCFKARMIELQDELQNLDIVQ